MTTENRYEANHPEVVDESVDGEVLIVHLGTGAYYSARGTGDLAWQLLAAGSTAPEAASALRAVESDIDAFALQLIEEGLLRPRTVAPTSCEVAPPTSWLAPVLEKYTDMQELLLLDPIHEVEEAGWPNARPIAPSH